MNDRLMQFYEGLFGRHQQWRLLDERPQSRQRDQQQWVTAVEDESDSAATERQEEDTVLDSSTSRASIQQRS